MIWFYLSPATCNLSPLPFSYNAASTYQSDRTMTEASSDLPHCTLPRRLAAILYDTLLLLAILFIASAARAQGRTTRQHRRGDAQVNHKELRMAHLNC